MMMMSPIGDDDIGDDIGHHHHCHYESSSCESSVIILWNRMLQAHWLPTCLLQMHKQAHPGVSSLTLMGTFVSRVNITLFSVRIKLVTETIRKSLLVSKSREDFSWKPAIKNVTFMAFLRWPHLINLNVMTLWRWVLSKPAPYLTIKLKNDQFTPHIWWHLTKKATPRYTHHYFTFADLRPVIIFPTARERSGRQEVERGRGWTTASEEDPANANTVGLSSRNTAIKTELRFLSSAEMQLREHFVECVWDSGDAVPVVS